MTRFLRSVMPIAAAALALTGQMACSSDDGDDDAAGGTGGASGSGGSSGASSGGSGGSGTNPCGMECAAGDFCSQCANPSNPDVPTYACISEGTAC